MNRPAKTLRAPSIARYLAVSIATYLAVTVSARADATWVGDTSNLWNDATNWSSDPANPTGNFFINTATGNLPVLNANSSFTPVDVIIGDANSTGRFDQTAGTLSLNDISANGNWFFVGRSGGTGTYNLANTSVTGAGISGYGQGTGSLNVGKLWVGGACFFDNGTGVVNINTSGTITANSTQDFFGITAAPIIVGMAFNGTASGTINLENGTVQSNGQVFIGRNATGIFNQSGGTMNSTSYFVIGRDAGADGQYTLSGGTVNAATNDGFVVLGSFGGAQGRLSISGGTFNVANNTQLLVGEGGAGTLTVSNAGLVTVNHPTEGLRLAANGGSTGTVHLDGGTIQTTLVTKGGGSGTFNFNGGTLKAAGNNGAFLQGLNSAFVKTNGAKFDSNGFQITVGQDLIGDSAFPGGGLSKIGAGALTLTGNSTYTGVTSVTGGTLNVSGSGAINASTGIVINGAGAKYVHASSVASTRPITVTQGTLDGAGAVGAVTVGAGTGATIANGDGAAGQLTMSSLLFNGAAAMSLKLAGGATTGTPAIAVTNALTTPGSAGAITVNVTPTTPLTLGSTYSLMSYGSFSGSLSDFIYGGNSARVTGAFGNTGAAITLTVNGDTPKWTGLDNGEWKAAATGGNSNWKLQTALTATNYIESDIVLFDDTASGTKLVNISTANVSPASTSFNTAGTYSVSSGGGFGIAGTGSVSKSGAGKVTFTTANTTTGPVTITAGTLELGDGTTDGSFNNSASITNHGTLAYNVAGSQSYHNVISGNGAVTKSGSGTLTLGAANSYSGGFSANAGLTLASNAGALGSGTLKLNGGSFGTTLGATIANPVDVTGTSTIGHAGQGNEITFAGNFTGSGTLKNFLGSPGASNVFFTGDLSAFTGTMEYTNAIANAQWWRVGTNGATVNLSSARLVLNRGDLTDLNAPSRNFGFRDFINGATLKVGALSGDGAFQASFNNSGPNTLEVGALNTNTTFSGVIGGGGAGANMALTKVGTGTLTLTGNNSYTGNTAINAGKLTIDGAIVGTSIVNNGGTLGGTGNVGWTILNDGGAIAPGDGGVGTLTIAGGARFLDWFGSSDSNFGQMKFELSVTDGTSDKITGLQYFTKASPGGSFTFDFLGTGASTGPGGTLYTLIEFENLGAINGANAFTASDFSYKNLGDGLTGTFVVNANNVQLQVVPEPGTAVALLGGIATVCFRRRSRRQG